MLVPQSCGDESQSDVDLETTFKKRKKFHSVSTFRKYAYSFPPFFIYLLIIILYFVLES